MGNITEAVYNDHVKEWNTDWKMIGREALAEEDWRTQFVASSF